MRAFLVARKLNTIEDEGKVKKTKVANPKNFLSSSLSEAFGFGDNSSSGSSSRNSSSINNCFYDFQGYVSNYQACGTL